LYKTSILIECYINKSLYLHTIKIQKLTIMAIAIKSTPILTDSAARKFEQKAKVNLQNKSTVDFTKQMEIAKKILAKAKI